MSSVEASSITMMSVSGTWCWIWSITVEMFAASLCVGTMIRVRMKPRDYPAGASSGAVHCCASTDKRTCVLIAAMTIQVTGAAQVKRSGQSGPLA